MSVYKNDSADYLDKALRSIYDDQTKKPHEIVVVFDGPLTSELYSVLKNFRTGREDIVFYYPLESNVGLGAALKTGAEKCTGDYILRMDSDDISVPTRFEKQIAYLENSPEVDVLGADISEFSLSPDDETIRKRVCPPTHDEIARMIRKRNPINHMTACIRRSALSDVGGYVHLPLMEDYYLWLRMIAKGYKFANINESLVYVRIGNGFNRRRSSASRISSCKTIQKFMIEHRMISRIHAVINVINMWAITNAPAWLKDIVYSRFFRRKP